MSKNSGDHIDLKKATGTSISFASGGGLLGGSLAGLFGALLLAVILGLIGFAIVASLKNER